MLGAGGVVGFAFHAGVLSALAEGTGWEPGTADTIVGTSAGSVAGSLLRAGVTSEDLAAEATGRAYSARATELREVAGPPSPIPTSRPLPGSLRMAAPRLLVRAALRPRGAPRLGTLAAAALPAGRISSEHVVGGIRRIFGSDWPVESLLICAVRLDSGKRLVFGAPGAPQTDVATAVAASCAIPGYYRPVMIDGVPYVDGGVHSPTNADLLVGAGLDLVVVSSPMSAARGAIRRAVDFAARAAFRRRLGVEVGALRRSGTPVVVLQPSAEDLPLMGLNGMNPRRRHDVTRQVRETTFRRLESSALRDALGPLVAA